MTASRPSLGFNFYPFTSMAIFGKKKKGAGDAAPATPPAESKPEKVVQPAAPKVKVRPDFYTLLLGLSVAALIVASVLLYLNIEAYGPDPISSLPGIK